MYFIIFINLFLVFTLNVLQKVPFCNNNNLAADLETERRIWRCMAW